MQEVKINIQRISDAQHKDDLVVEKRYEELLKSSDVDMINVRRHTTLWILSFLMEGIDPWS